MTQRKDFIEFVQYLQKEIDTNFYAQYRPKGDEYFFFYTNEEAIRGSFVPNDSVEMKIKSMCKQLGVKDIWKYKNENFYRFHIKAAGRRFNQILILKKNETNFAMSEGSKVAKAKQIQNVNEIQANYKTSFIFKVSNSILIYFEG